MSRLAPLLLLSWACAHRVPMQVPAAPAVDLSTTTVAVVAQDRECRPVALSLIEQLKESADFQVDYRSEVRLLVFQCNVDIGWSLFHEVDGTSNAPVKQRADVVGRGHAMIAVMTEDGTVAHLVGGARDGHVGLWQRAGLTNMLQTRRAMQRRLTDSVAVDLVSQLNPLPQTLDRWVYPNPEDGSARQLHNLAVLAEQSGDLVEARRLAQAAVDQKPTSRSEVYLESLERRLQNESH